MENKINYNNKHNNNQKQNNLIITTFILVVIIMIILILLYKYISNTNKIKELNSSKKNNDNLKNKINKELDSCRIVNCNSKVEEFIDHHSINLKKEINEELDSCINVNCVCNRIRNIKREHYYHTNMIKNYNSLYNVLEIYIKNIKTNDTINDIKLNTLIQVNYEYKITNCNSYENLSIKRILQFIYTIRETINKMNMKSELIEYVEFKVKIPEKYNSSLKKIILNYLGWKEELGDYEKRRIEKCFEDLIQSKDIKKESNEEKYERHEKIKLSEYFLKIVNEHNLVLDKCNKEIEKTYSQSIINIINEDNLSSDKNLSKSLTDDIIDIILFYKINKINEIK